MITREFADRFAEEWIAAWNDHDLDRILSHYAEDIEMCSPYIARIAGEPSGRLKGKPALRAYWSKALDQMPTLRFQWRATLVGVESLVVYYEGVHGMAAEVFFFDRNGAVTRAFAHYA